jgi:microcystin-dependent protein
MEPFVGELRVFAFGQIPKGWHACDGTILQIKPYVALYALLGKVYGGDGVNTFALPDLRSRAPLQFNGTNPSYTMGSAQGTESVTLSAATIPQHNHIYEMTNAAANLPATAANQNNYMGLPTIPTTGAVVNSFGPTTNLVPLSPNALQGTANGPHENRMPYLALNVCIALLGYFPQRP